jgi:hypothetical protein
MWEKGLRLVQVCAGRFFHKDGGGVVKYGVRKYSKVLGLNHVTTSGEIGVTRISPSNPIPGKEKSIGVLPNFNLHENPADGITRKGEAYIGVSK